jgi:hypothetical protein
MVSKLFVVINVKRRDLSEDQGINGKNFGMDLRETGWEGVDWMHLAQDRDQWWAVLNTVMNLQVP